MPTEDEVLLLPGTMFTVKDCLSDPLVLVDLRETSNIGNLLES